MMQRDVATSGTHADRCVVEGVTAAGTVQDSHLIPFSFLSPQKEMVQETSTR